MPTSCTAKHERRETRDERQETRDIDVCRCCFAEIGFPNLDMNDISKV